jgi:hypothetical protein
MNILGGSPLGLVGVSSTANGDRMSTFSGGGSRNVNVDDYNKAVSKTYPIKDIGNYTFAQEDVNVYKGTRSLFNQSVIAPYGILAGVKKDNGVDRKLLHNNNIYDLSLLNIIEVLSKTQAALRPSEFAYLKDVGVYPNNRLMIARRFPSAIGDNILGRPNPKVGPMVTLISWKPQEEDFLEMSFGEEWENAKADFTDVLNSLGKDFSMSGGLALGNITGAALGGIPLPGFTEVLQRKVLTRLGILDDTGNEPLPSGNPNLIKEAKRRKTITFSEAGSGLKCSVSIKMVCTWEQKFISGIDPTIVFQDILSTITRFGTSNSDTYGLSKNANNKIQDWVDHPELIVKDLITAIADSLNGVASALKQGIDFGETSDKKTEQTAEQAQKQAGFLQTKIINTIIATGKEILEKSIQKYKIEIEGIGRALSGAPSTPWHITIGNPMRPIFCSGDMYMNSDIKLNLGPTLAFNDLPSTITAEFTLVNARPWGMQEILAKFNAGSIRVSSGIKDYNSQNPGGKVGTDTNKIESNSNINNSSNASTGVSSITNKSSQANLVKKTVAAQEEVNKFEADRKKINELEKGININPIPIQNPTELRIKPSVNINSELLKSSTKRDSIGETINSDASSIYATTQNLKS